MCINSRENKEENAQRSEERHSQRSEERHSQRGEERHSQRGEERHSQRSEERHSHSHSHLHSHSHSHELFCEIYSRKEAQLCDMKLEIKDSEGVEKAKKLVENNKNYENLITLGNALCFQLRYREAVHIFENAIEIDGGNDIAHRKLALCCLKTDMLDKAESEYQICENHTKNTLDIAYRLGLVAYYKGDYKKAKFEFYRSFDLAKNNGEMYIAVIYWYILTIVKLGESVEFVKTLYNDKIQCGHHIGYQLTAKLFCGIDTQEHLYEVAKATDELTLIIYLYGQYVFNQMLRNPKKAKACIDEVQKTDKYWASFAYLGGYYDLQKEKI